MEERVRDFSDFSFPYRNFIFGTDTNLKTPKQTDLHLKNNK